jgi:hypothetical protein
MPCDGCVVEVLDGPSAGEMAKTAGGAFSLTIRDATMSVQLRISKEGFAPVTTIANAAEGSNVAVVRVVLESVARPLPLAARYTIEISASESSEQCVQLPPEARSRSYDVTLEPAYGSGTFWARPANAVDKFLLFIGVSGGVLLTYAEDGNNESAGIVDRLPSGATRSIHVWSAPTEVVDPRRIDLPVTGEITYCAGSQCTVCDSQSHRFVMTAR